MTKPRIDAPILDQAPTEDKLTDYDRLHLITYIRLVDADADGMPWEEASHSILHIDPETEPERAKCSHQSHLARAQWMTRVGYRHIQYSQEPRVIQRRAVFPAMRFMIEVVVGFRAIDQ